MVSHGSLCWLACCIIQALGYKRVGEFAGYFPEASSNRLFPVSPSLWLSNLPWKGTIEQTKKNASIFLSLLPLPSCSQRIHHTRVDEVFGVQLWCSDKARQGQGRASQNRKDTRSKQEESKAAGQDSRARKDSSTGQVGNMLLSF